MLKELRHISKEPQFQNKNLGSQVSFCVRLSVSPKKAIEIKVSVFNLCLVLFG